MSSETPDSRTFSAETTSADSAPAQGPEGGNIFDDLGHTIDRAVDKLAHKMGQKSPEEQADDFARQHHGRIEGSDEQEWPPATI